MRAVHGGVVCAMAWLAAAAVTSCTAGGQSNAVQDFEDALQPLRDAKSFRMTGEMSSPDGTKTAFDARLEGHGSCEGIVGGAESFFVGRRVWTRWDGATLPEAVNRLSGSSAAPADPAADPADDPQWTAVKLLQGAFMVTKLPGDPPQTEGIAPVRQTGLLLAGAATGADDVTIGATSVRGKEWLRSLSRTDGPVTVRVYVPAQGAPETRLAEYQVEGGRSFSVRFSDLGMPVTVSPPLDQQIVSSHDVMAVLR